LCAARGIPAPKVLAMVAVGAGANADIELDAVRVEDAPALSSFLGSFGKRTRLIFKAIEGSYGHGTLSLKVDGGVASDAAGRPVDAEAVMRHCRAYPLAKGFIVQAFLTPDPALQPYMPGGALGTVRVVTVVVRGEALIPYAFLKVPVGKNSNDAFDHGQSGNLAAAVSPVDGTIGPAWGDLGPLALAACAPTMSILTIGCESPAPRSRAGRRSAKRRWAARWRSPGKRRPSGGMWG
jgi:Sugar-transfer associated ATP-grasp